MHTVSSDTLQPAEQSTDEQLTYESVFDEFEDLGCLNDTEPCGHYEPDDWPLDNGPNEDVIVPRGDMGLPMFGWVTLAGKEYDPDSILIGTTTNPTVRKCTKNLVFGKEKALKTTYMIRLSVSHAIGRTLIPQLPVLKPERVLYLHGELDVLEIADRMKKATADQARDVIEECSFNFWSYKNPDFDFITEQRDHRRTGAAPDP